VDIDAFKEMLLNPQTEIHDRINRIILSKLLNLPIEQLNALSDADYHSTVTREFDHLTERKLFSVLNSILTIPNLHKLNFDWNHVRPIAGQTVRKASLERRKMTLEELSIVNRSLLFSIYYPQAILNDEEIISCLIAGGNMMIGIFDRHITEYQNDTTMNEEERDSLIERNLELKEKWLQRNEGFNALIINIRRIKKELRDTDPSHPENSENIILLNKLFKIYHRYVYYFSNISNINESDGTKLRFERFKKWIREFSQQIGFNNSNQSIPLNLTQINLLDDVNALEQYLMESIDQSKRDDEEYWETHRSKKLDGSIVEAIDSAMGVERPAEQNKIDEILKKLAESKRRLKNILERQQNSLSIVGPVQGLIQDIETLEDSIDQSEPTAAELSQIEITLNKISQYCDEEE
jgi:hypothetical protein